MTTSIHHVVLGADDADAAASFYTDVLDIGASVTARHSDAPTTGFRGFTLGLDVAGPTAVLARISAAVEAGATVLKEPAAQPWGGHSGVVQASDGAIWKIATSAGSDAEPADTAGRVVLLLGTADVRASQQFYVDRGLAVARSAGGQYVEFEPGAGTVTLGLYKRPGLAKEFGVSPEGSGSSRLAIATDGPGFTDPDGFTWEPVSDRAV